jgi:hypothetical protein
LALILDLKLEKKKVRVGSQANNLVIPLMLRMYLLHFYTSQFISLKSWHGPLFFPFFFFFLKIRFIFFLKLKIYFLTALSVGCIPLRCVLEVIGKELGSWFFLSFKYGSHMKRLSKHYIGCMM